MKNTISLGNHRDFENYRDLLLVLVQKEIKIRYKGKALGYLWSVASPLAFAVVYFIVFSIIMQVRVENYTLILLSGLFPWQWFSNSVGSAPRMFAGNASIIKKVNFPRNIIPLATILNHMVHFVLSLPVILLFLAIFHQAPSINWLYGFPILMSIQLLMLYGIALFLASLNLFFRDIERLTSIILHFTFYFTPVLYTVDMIPEEYRYLINFNPAAPLIVSWRQLILYNTMEFPYIAISLLYAVLFFALGYAVYRKLSWRFAEVL